MLLSKREINSSDGAKMSSSNNTFDWRIGYVVFSLVFVVWVVYLGLDNFDKVHGEYRIAQARLQPSQVKDIALQELIDQCRKKLKRSGPTQVAGDKASGMADGDCLSFPEAVLLERQKTVTSHLVSEEKRFKRKLIVFYISFGVFFIVLPLYVLYLLLSFFIWLFRGLKFVK